MRNETQRCTFLTQPTGDSNGLHSSVSRDFRCEVLLSFEYSRSDDELEIGATNFRHMAAVDV